MNDQVLDAKPVGRAKAGSPRRVFDLRAAERAMAGSRRVARADCGPPTRQPSGEWMQRIAFDLPEAMLDALKERAGGDRARMGEVIRAALAAAGVGDASHVAGICDGTWSDDQERAEAAEVMRLFDPVPE